MSSRFIAIIFIIFAFNISFLIAQDSKNIKVSVHGNLNIPTGQFGSGVTTSDAEGKTTKEPGYDMSIGFAGMVEYPLLKSIPELAFTGSVHLANFESSSNADVGRDVNDVQFQTFGIKVGVLYYYLIKDEFELFAGGDFGVYLTKGLKTYYGTSGGNPYLGGGGDQAEGRFGFSPVIGGDYVLSPSFSINAALRYTYLTSVEPKVDQQYKQVTIDLSPTYFSFYIGVALYL